MRGPFLGFQLHRCHPRQAASLPPCCRQPAHGWVLIVLHVYCCASAHLPSSQTVRPWAQLRADLRREAEGEAALLAGLQTAPIGSAPGAPPGAAASQDKVGAELGTHAAGFKNKIERRRSLVLWTGMGG